MTRKEADLSAGRYSKRERDAADAQKVEVDVPVTKSKKTVESAPFGSDDEYEEDENQFQTKLAAALQAPGAKARGKQGPINKTVTKVTSSSKLVRTKVESVEVSAQNGSKAQNEKEGPSGSGFEQLFKPKRGNKNRNEMQMIQGFCTTSNWKSFAAGAHLNLHQNQYV